MLPDISFTLNGTQLAWIGDQARVQDCPARYIAKMLPGKQNRKASAGRWRKLCVREGRFAKKSL